jgi:CDP-diacylglycerol--glycerol-3-phosphate 3-phosphatidyltransferase
MVGCGAEGLVHQRLTVPNILTVARIAMAGAAAWLAARHHADALAVSILIAAALLDAFDGWYARRFAQSSALGQHLDPFADKILMGVVYTWIGVDAGSRWVWALIALAGAREAAVTLLRWHSRRRYARLIPASRLGRFKTLVQNVAGLTILSVAHFLGHTVPVGIVSAAVFVTLLAAYASGIAYLVDWRRGQALDALRARAESKGACRRPEADPLCATQNHG